MRAAVRYTELSLCRGVRRVGHIDRRIEPFGDRPQEPSDNDRIGLSTRSTLAQARICTRGHTTVCHER